jgi:polysaccharide export outer membrane protein
MAEMSLLQAGKENGCVKIQLLGLKMLSLFCRAFLTTVALAYCAIGTGQTVQGATASTAQPLDARMGVFRPAASDLSGGADAKAPPAAGVPQISLGKDYRVGPNDLLDIEVPDLEKENSKRTVRVNAAGAITLPLIGAVVVAGLTAQQIESHIADKYGEKYLQNPQVSVFIKEFTTERITVDGAVVKPGIYPLTGQITLLRALALAGGFGPIADSNEVMLFRVNEKGERQVATFDVDKIRSGKSDDPTIKGDDLIVVQRDNNRRLLKDSLFRDVLDSLNPFSIFARP